VEHLQIHAGYPLIGSFQVRILKIQSQLPDDGPDVLGNSLDPASFELESTAVDTSTVFCQSLLRSHERSLLPPIEAFYMTEACTPNLRPRPLGSL
jgi:hypothetical protein